MHQDRSHHFMSWGVISVIMPVLWVYKEQVTVKDVFPGWESLQLFSAMFTNWSVITKWPLSYLHYIAAYFQRVMKLLWLHSLATPMSLFSHPVFTTIKVSSSNKVFVVPLPAETDWSQTSVKGKMMSSVNCSVQRCHNNTIKGRVVTARMPHVKMFNKVQMAIENLTACFEKSESELCCCLASGAVFDKADI